MITAWERLTVSDTLHKYLRGTYHAWARTMDGERIFTVRMIGETPGVGDGGYYSVSAALKAKGMMSCA